MGFIARIFSPPKMPSYTPPAMVIQQPIYDNSAAEAAAAEAAEKQKRAALLAKGRASTLLMGGEGITTPAPVKLKRALGE